MNRTDNIQYKFQGDKIQRDEFIRLLCESVYQILNTSVEVK